MANNEERKIHPPPPPSTPREAPWRDVAEIISGLKAVTQKLDSLISLYTGVPVAPPAVPPVAPPVPPVVPPGYACPYCGAEFSTIDELLAHQTAQHPDLPLLVAYVCPHCEAQFDSLEALNAHIATAHPAASPVAPPGMTYACPYCGAELSTVNELLAHLAAEHPGQPPQVLYGCPYCGAQFDSLEALNAHIATMHPPVPPVAPPAVPGVIPAPPELEPITSRLDRLIAARTNRATFATGQRTVSKPEQLDDLPVPDGFQVTIIAKTENTGYIYLGSTKSDCANTARRFDGLGAGLAVSLRIKNLNKVWVDASVSGEGVSWIVEQ